MRLVLEILVAAALIALAWEKSLSERANELPWLGDKVAPTTKTPDRSRHVVTPAPTASGAWMWDAKRRSVLDAPSPKKPTPH